MDHKVKTNKSRMISINALARLVNGKIVGHLDGKRNLTGTCSITTYMEGKISFVKNSKYADILAQLQNAVVLIPEELSGLCEIYPQNIYIIVEDVPNSMIILQDAFYSDQYTIMQEGISDTCKIGANSRTGGHVYIGDSVHIGADVNIGDYVRIMNNCFISNNVTIEKGTLIYPNVCIYPDCHIGVDCIIHAGACIGVDGFRFEQDIEKQIVRKMLHVGGVVIGNRVEIGANTAIDRATFEGDNTVISDDVKIDNLVHIAHNVRIGARSIIVTQSCIGGSATIGEDVWIGIGVSISNGVVVGKNAKVLLNAVVAHDIADGEMVSGFYAMPHKQWKRIYQRLIEGEKQ